MTTNTINTPCDICARDTQNVKLYAFDIERMLFDATTGLYSPNPAYRSIMLCLTDYNKMLILRNKYRIATGTTPDPAKSIELLINYRSQNPIRKVNRYNYSNPNQDTTYCKYCGSLNDKNGNCTNALCNLIERV